MLEFVGINLLTFFWPRAWNPLHVNSVLLTISYGLNLGLVPKYPTSFSVFVCMGHIFRLSGFVLLSIRI